MVEAIYLFTDSQKFSLVENQILQFSQACINEYLKDENSDKKFVIYNFIPKDMDLFKIDITASFFDLSKNLYKNIIETFKTVDFHSLSSDEMFELTRSKFLDNDIKPLEEFIVYLKNLDIVIDRMFEFKNLTADDHPKFFKASHFHFILSAKDKIIETVDLCNTIEHEEDTKVVVITENILSAKKLNHRKENFSSLRDILPTETPVECNVYMVLYSDDKAYQKREKAKLKRVHDIKVDRCYHNIIIQLKIDNNGVSRIRYRFTNLYTKNLFWY